MKKDFLILFILIVLILILSFLIRKEENYKGIDIPQNYTLENYSVAEVLDIQCKKYTECETPDEYLVRSSCPYTTICLKNKCTVVCPKPIKI